MAYAEIEYSEEGLPMCEICGKHFKRVLTHVRQKHHISERDYKKKFGFDLKKGICSKESSEATRVKTLGNYEKCIERNLLQKGKRSRYVKGHPGRSKEKLSDQSRRALVARMKSEKMRKVSSRNGKLYGRHNLPSSNPNKPKL